MMNIMLVGVGGQGLVLTSGILAEVAKRCGYDVKSNDVIGLSQRGGRVFSNVRYGKKVYSPNIQVGQADHLLALEPLEGLRSQNMLKENGTVFINSKVILPSDVVFEKEIWPQEAYDAFLVNYESYAVDATEVGKGIGNKRVSNVILLGMLACKLDLDLEAWHSVIQERVPKKALKQNMEAFQYGYDLVKEA